ncbi:MAG: TlpA disulfide reductase family protein [Blastocatellia bacterium]
MKKMNKTAIKALMMSIGLAVAMTCLASPIAQSVPELPKADGSGDTPEITLDLYQIPGVEAGGKLKLSSLNGKVVLLDMFLSSCPHCQDHAPHIVEMYNKFKQRGFTVVSIASDDKSKPDSAKNVAKYAAKAKINYPVGQISYEVIAYYGDPKNAGVPQMVLFGADGKMAFRETGWDEALGKRLAEAIEAQLSKLPTVKPGSKASAKPKKEKTKLG